MNALFASNGKTEVFAPIAAAPRYEVSSMGNIRNVETGKILKAYPTASRSASGAYRPTEARYLGVTLYLHDGTRIRANVHALVCEAFNGKRRDGMDADHINGDHLDNRARNLRWLRSDLNRKKARRPKIAA